MFKFVLCLLAFLLFSKFALSQDSKIIVPVSDEINAAKTKFDSIFAERIKSAKSPEEMTKITDDVRSMAASEKGAFRYVLLRSLIPLLADRPVEAVKAFRVLTTEYDTNGNVELADLVKRIKPDPQADNTEGWHLAILLEEACLLVPKFTEAKEALAIAEKFTSKRQNRIDFLKSETNRLSAFANAYAAAADTEQKWRTHYVWTGRMRLLAGFEGGADEYASLLKATTKPHTSDKKGKREYYRDLTTIFGTLIEKNDGFPKVALCNWGYQYADLLAELADEPDKSKFGKVSEQWKEIVVEDDRKNTSFTEYAGLWSFATPQTGTMRITRAGTIELMTTAKSGKRETVADLKVGEIVRPQFTPRVTWPSTKRAADEDFPKWKDRQLWISPDLKFFALER